MSKRARVTPEIIQRVKEISDDHPEMCRWEIGKKIGVSDATVGRILNDEYEIVEGKAVRIYNHIEKIPLPPAPLAMIKQFQKVLEANMHEAAEMSRENKVRDAINNLKNDLLKTDIEFEHLAEECKDELDEWYQYFTSMGFFHLADEVCREKKRRKKKEV